MEPKENSGEHVTKIVQEFIRLHDAGDLVSLDEFCDRYPEGIHSELLVRCEDIKGIQRMLSSTEPYGDPVGKRLGDFRILEEFGSLRAKFGHYQIAK